jgi:hypothetical protein
MTCIYFSYTGRLPTLQVDYADTFGNHSAKYFRDFRHHALETSRTNMCQGGYFPSLYSFGPQSAVEYRTRRLDRWLKTPRCRLLTMDCNRREELANFHEVRAVNSSPVGLYLGLPVFRANGVVQNTLTCFSKRISCMHAEKQACIYANYGCMIALTTIWGLNVGYVTCCNIWGYECIYMYE